MTEKQIINLPQPNKDRSTTLTGHRPLITKCADNHPCCRSSHDHTVELKHTAERNGGTARCDSRCWGTPAYNFRVSKTALWSVAFVDVRCLLAHMCTMSCRARSIGHIWLLWIRVRAFDWSDPDPLDRDLVNPATVQCNRISRWHTESAGTVAVPAVRAARPARPGSRAAKYLFDQSNAPVVSWQESALGHRVQCREPLNLILRLPHHVPGSP